MVYTLLKSYAKGKSSNLRGVNYTQEISIIRMGSTENQLKVPHNLTLNTHNFPGVNIDVTLELKSLALNNILCEALYSKCTKMPKVHIQQRDKTVFCTES